MKRLSVVPLLIISLLVISCGTSSHITASWKDPEAALPSQAMRTIFIASMSRNMEVRTKLEAGLSKEATRHNVKPILSTQYFTPEFYGTSPDRNELISRIRQSGADMILTVTLIDKENETRYVPGTPYAPYGRFGWYGGFYNYYNYRYPFMADPGHYVQDKTYFLETNLYDVATEKLIWSAQSETVNPSSIDRFAKEYPKVLAKQMQADGLIQ